MKHILYVSTEKTCSRCGTKFYTNRGERICSGCRKEPVEDPQEEFKKPLSFRELQVVNLVSQGKANKEIAFLLILSEGTVKEYINRIFKKVGVGNRTELAVWSISQQSQAKTKGEIDSDQPSYTIGII